MNIKITKLLKRALLKCKYNQAELGRQLGMNTRQQISSVLRGIEPLPKRCEPLLYEFMGVQYECNTKQSDS